MGTGERRGTGKREGSHLRTFHAVHGGTLDEKQQGSSGGLPVCIFLNALYRNFLLMIVSCYFTL